jgi:Transglycosylase SLT domain/Domain of unknown function (DUF4124)
MTFLCRLGLQPNKIWRKQLLNWKQMGCHIAAALALLAGMAGSAHADVWGFVDEKGVTHFAAEQLDARYELYFKSGQNFDTKEGWVAVPPSPVEIALDTPAQASSVGMPTVASKIPPRLQTFFDVSPNFKAVKHHLREASAAHRIDFELLQALIATESGFDTMAVSPKGAVGLMQLMPPTAQRYGVRGDAKTPIEKKLTDPKTNIRAGSRYLGDLIALYPGKLELALAAYNAGEGAVKRYGNQIPPYKETQNYVKTIMQIYTTLKPPVALARRLVEAKPVEVKPAARVRMVIGGATGGLSVV